MESLERLVEEQEQTKEVRNMNKADNAEEGGEGGIDRGVPVGVTPSDHTDLVPIISSNTISFLRRYLVILEFMTREQAKYANDFRVVIQKAPPNPTTPSLKRKSTDVMVTDAQEKLPASFHIWCMNAAVAFTDTVQDCHSVILTSGTLAPLDSFASELGTSFPIRLEASHVINLSKQLFAGVFHTYMGKSLDGSHTSQQNDWYLDVLGNAISMLVRLTPGGLLVFLSSYGLMYRLQERWRHTKVLDDIEDVTHSEVFFEEKTTEHMQKQLDRYYAALSTVGSRAVMLAVSRGKVSEGINFSDHYARTVVIVGRYCVSVYIHTYSVY
ncbi:hypothetical protein EON65_57120 [archaeon]|nr:MAG: hypothetical protein EON65_57120 [archaeon]